MDRSTVLRGPAALQLNGVDFWSVDDIAADTSPETFPINISAYGKYDERMKDMFGKVTVTPIGKWAGLTTLFPYNTMKIGASIFGAVDVPLIVRTLDDKKITFKIGRAHV